MRPSRSSPVLVAAALLRAAHPSAATAQTTPAAAALAPSLPTVLLQDTVDDPFGAEFLLPFGSLVLPGLGQYTQGAGWTGAAYTTLSLGGGLLATVGDPSADALPRAADDQLAYEALHVSFTAGALSAWDAFHRAMPRHRALGRYDFLPEREGVGDLLSAPFDFRFLGRWTTWVELSLAGTVAAFVLTDTDDDLRYPPFRARDAAFITSLSMNAAVGEEALFRGWLLPMLHQKLGEQFWSANLIQSALFGAGHAAQAQEFAFVIGASAAYFGWVTRRNGWSIRESIFQHFWYDMIVGTATLIRDRDAAVPLPTLTIRF